MNPAHLEPVTRRVNILRGSGHAAEAVRTGKCKRGHDLVPGNLYVSPKGQRHCRKCRRLREIARMNGTKISQMPSASGEAAAAVSTAITTGGRLELTAGARS